MKPDPDPIQRNLKSGSGSATLLKASWHCAKFCIYLISFSICLCVLSINLTVFYRLIYLSICSSIYLFYSLSIIYLSIYLSILIYLTSTRLSAYLSFIYLSRRSFWGGGGGAVPTLAFISFT